MKRGRCALTTAACVTAQPDLGSYVGWGTAGPSCRGGDTRTVMTVAVSPARNGEAVRCRAANEKRLLLQEPAMTQRDMHTSSEAEAQREQV